MTIQFTFTDEERKYLAALLDSVYRDKHAEVRRTEFSSSLHDQLRREEILLRGLLEKLQAGEAACNV
ncbi:MAG TPA: hypothetical protein VG826_25630 [Pirellulales bacterium]|nr:hypothetical protein [Pirellulales bacterium]